MIALALASAAHGQAAQERVTLIDGTVMQGELVEKVPGDHVTIKLVTGEVRTIQWSALAPQAPPPQPQGGLGLQAPSAAPQGPTTHVEIDADKPGVALLRITSFGVVNAYTAYGSASGGFMNFETVCMAPCAADVDANGMYRVAGEGVTPSSTFGLGAPSGAVRLHVTAGSAAERIGGVWLLIGGITLGVTGGLTAGLFAALNDPYTNMTGWIVAGAVMAGVGVIMTAIGIPLIVGSGTSVVTDQGMPLAKQPAKPRLTLSGLVF